MSKTPKYAVGDVLLIDPDAMTADGGPVFYDESVSAVVVVEAPDQAGDYTVQALDGVITACVEDGVLRLGAGTFQYVGEDHLERYDTTPEPSAIASIFGHPVTDLSWTPLGRAIIADAEKPALPRVEDLPLSYVAEVLEFVAELQAITR